MIPIPNDVFNVFILTSLFILLKFDCLFDHKAGNRRSFIDLNIYTRREGEKVGWESQLSYD